jgi:hypothetical protein
MTAWDAVTAQRRTATPLASDRLGRPLITDLHRDNARLRAELEATRADVEALQSALREVTPLTRHLSRDVKRRLRRADSAARRVLAPRAGFVAPEVAGSGASVTDLLDAANRSDRAGFTAFNSQPTSTVALRAYTRLSRATYTQLRRVLAAAKRRLR